MRGCAVSRRYINVCNCNMFSVVNVYLEYMKFCRKCRRYVCSCDDICMCVVHKQFELLEFVIDSVYVDLQYEISITFTAGSVSLCCVCSHVAVFRLSVRLLDSLCGWKVQVSIYVYDRHRKARLNCVWLSDLDLSRHHQFL